MSFCGGKKYFFFVVSVCTVSFATMSSEVKISKLKEQKDWTLWKLQAKVVLKTLEVFSVVDKTEKYPILEKQDPSATELAAYEKLILAWDKKDVKAQSVILTSIESQALLHIVSCKPSSEMWDKLHSVFEQKSQSGIHFLLQKFFQYEKNDDDDIANFISKLEEIVQQLSDLDEKISEKMIITRILMALPPSFNHFHSAWESTAENSKNLTNLRNRLMIEEKRMSVQESSESGAFVARHFSKQKRSFESRKRKCYSCGSDTHLKRDCMREKDKDTKKQKSEALCCDALLAVNDSDAWYLPSGATEHMSSNRKAFYDFVELEEPHPVKIGNGQIIYGTGIGKIEISVFDGTVGNEKHLVDVLYVPVIHTNLFSQGKCLDKGFTLSSNANECIIYDGSRIVARGVRQTGLYKMLIKTKQRSIAVANIAVKAESIRVWHERFAHQNVTHTKMILKRNGVNYIDEPNFQCEPCIIGKHHQKPFKGKNETTTQIELSER